MAYMKHFESLYQAFRLFVDRCLLHDQSMIWPDQPIWTLANLQSWKTMVIGHPEAGGNASFKEKLEQQLTGAPQVLWALTADLHYAFYLPSATITFLNRYQNIAWAAQKAGLSMPREDDPIWAAQQKGFTSTTLKYHFRHAQFSLLVLWALRLKELGKAEKILSDSDATQASLDEILSQIPNRSDRANDLRHAILYLMFPEKYENIISTTRKETIITAYRQFIPEVGTDVDFNLFQARQGLIKTRGIRENFDFYFDLRQEWEKGDADPSAAPSIKIDQVDKRDDDDIVIESLRLLNRFKNLILYGPPGTGKTYWAREIARRLIAPQLDHGLPRAAFLQSCIEDLSFYDIVALNMYLEGADRNYSVHDLEALELIQIRFRQNPVKHPSNQLWGYLQAHTAPDSTTVNTTSPRAEPFLFDKTKTSQWHLTQGGKEYIQNALIDRLDKIKKGNPAATNPEAFVRWVTFHQSYAYEDFVEGLRPVTAIGEASTLTFEIKQGIFRNVCARANEDPNNEYVLIIDEINRGNIAKIFGELMTLIEGDKRGSLAVELPYSKENFLVPKNLSIIGTMNTADRSIALLDVALRRRFAFMELMPDPTLLDSVSFTTAEEDALNLGDFLRRLNQRIVEQRGVDYQIGHSYFMPLINIGEEAEKLACLDDIWNFQVLSLLKEYFYGQPEALRQVLPSFFSPDEEQAQINDAPMILHGEDLIAALNKI